MTYELFIEPEAHDARKDLPGNVRQRIRRSIADLQADPRPARSHPLALAEGDLPAGIGIRRIRLEQWRVVYAVNDVARWVRVLAIRRRPLYDYRDLPDLIGKLTGRAS
jgi:mRNA interferase RelE/StbE